LETLVLIESLLETPPYSRFIVGELRAGLSPVHFSAGLLLDPMDEQLEVEGQPAFPKLARMAGVVVPAHLIRW
jgi:hypothetical protein